MQPTSTTKPVYLSLGSNIDPVSNLRRSISLLSRNPHLKICSISSVVETKAVGSTGPNFLNACISAETDLDAATLQSQVLRPIEDKLGRVRTADKNAARTMDLEIEVFDSQVFDPSAWRFAHVVVPLAEVAPGLRYPGSSRTAAEIAHLSKNDVWFSVRHHVDLGRYCFCGITSARLATSPASIVWKYIHASCIPPPLSNPAPIRRWSVPTGGRVMPSRTITNYR